MKLIERDGLSWVRELPVFKNSVKENIETYDVIEQWDSISHYDEGQENEWNIPGAFESHAMKSCFMNKDTNTDMLIQNNRDIIYMHTVSNSLDSEVSRFTRSDDNTSIISRLTDDISYKDKKTNKILTKARVMYTTEYDEETKAPIVIVKHCYKSDQATPETLDKTEAEVHNIISMQNGAIFRGIENYSAYKSNMIGDSYRAESMYAYTVDDELIKIDAKFTNKVTPTINNFILPHLNVDEDSQSYAVVYSRGMDSISHFMTEYYIQPENYFQIYAREDANTKTRFYATADGYDYTSTSKTHRGFNEHEYEIMGHTNCPLSAAYFQVILDAHGIPQFNTTPFLDSIFVNDLTGNYYRVYSTMQDIVVDSKIMYSHSYDEYGVIEHQIYYGGKEQEDVCKYNRERVIDDDGNYVGTYIESLVDSNPLAKRTTNEFFYRAVFIKEGQIVEDYRVLIKLDD